MKRLASTLFLVISSLALFAAPSSTTWPINQSTKHMGGDGNFFSIEVPISLIEKPPKGLIENPDTWYIPSIPDWKPIKSNTEVSWDIAKIHAHEATVVILIGKTEWTQLSEPQALPLINKIMEAAYVSPQTGKPLSTSSMSKEMLEGYVESVILLSIQKPGMFDDLATGYWPEAIKTPQEREIANKTCVPSQVVRTTDSTKISTNVLYYDGSIARWTLTLSPADSLKITSIETKEIYPKGSLGFPFGLEQF